MEDVPIVEADVLNEITGEFTRFRIKVIDKKETKKLRR